MNTDDAGRVKVSTTNIPASWNEGIAFDAAGRLCTTTALGALDRYQAGIRRSDSGLLVVADGVASARPYTYQAGLPFSKTTGALIRQVNVTPAPSDPYVAGVRIGLLGGVYMTTV